MKTLLVVDDSATSRAFFRTCLPDGGEYTIHEVGTGDSAVEKAKAVHPDICILDYNMPEKHGTDIAKEILELGLKPIPKFVLMTANTQKSVLEEAEKLGFIAVIEKPINPDMVNAVLKEIE